jgi:hypothetical protein
MPSPRVRRWDPNWVGAATVGSDAEDVEAIAAYLKDRFPQMSAVVASCTGLDQPTKDAWYALAKRIQAFLSMSAFARGVMAAAPGHDVANDARDMRDKFNQTAAALKSKGCGDVPTLMAHVPPPKDAPQSDASFWSALFGGANPVSEGVALALVVGLVLWARSSKG